MSKCFKLENSKYCPQFNGHYVLKRGSIKNTADFDNTLKKYFENKDSYKKFLTDKFDCNSEQLPDFRYRNSFICNNYVVIPFTNNGNLCSDEISQDKNANKIPYCYLSCYSNEFDKKSYCEHRKDITDSCCNDGYVIPDPIYSNENSSSSNISTILFILTVISSLSVNSSDNNLFYVFHEYIPKINDEIQLNVGDIVKIKEIFDDGWAYGTNISTDCEGALPLACCTEYRTCISSMVSFSVPVRPINNKSNQIK
ncbi:hypothetical protein LY90DRAFT_671250 [Neocallimastix californiae]|uniref:SH3 domain-containing protein n=1 Tax=Neocallimastix californiae TaxID=1754190 RepID=A0A1Y2CJL3_9FUNG|nr:hypothetical protein LY90DRAFT_671250 [Neocallimastix californiae]|eukprot:ORY47166.1 hypothetical protein LY90DRAFT_671250 [Neocallimastix californiae]